MRDTELFTPYPALSFTVSNTFTSPPWWFDQWNQVNYLYLLSRTQCVLHGSITSSIYEGPVSSDGNHHWKLIHRCMRKIPQGYFPLAYSLIKNPFIWIKWLTPAECHVKAPTLRNPVHGDPWEPHPRAPTHMATSTAHLCPADPWTRMPSAPALVLQAVKSPASSDPCPPLPPN